MRHTLSYEPSCKSDSTACAVLLLLEISLILAYHTDLPALQCPNDRFSTHIWEHTHQSDHQRPHTVFCSRHDSRRDLVFCRRPSSCSSTGHFAHPLSHRLPRSASLNRSGRRRSRRGWYRYYRSRCRRAYTRHRGCSRLPPLSRRHVCQ